MSEFFSWSKIVAGHKKAFDTNRSVSAEVFFSQKDLRSQVCINREQWRSEKKFASPKKRKHELIQLFLCATKFFNFLKPALIKCECAAKRNYKYCMMEFNREVNYLNSDFSNRDNSTSLAGIMITQQKNCDRLKSEWS